MPRVRSNAFGKLAGQLRHRLGCASEKGDDQIFESDDSNLHLHQFSIRQIDGGAIGTSFRIVRVCVTIGAAFVLPPRECFPELKRTERHRFGRVAHAIRRGARVFFA